MANLEKLDRPFLFLKPKKSERGVEELQGNPKFFYIKTKRLLDMFDNFKDEFDDFKISDLRKDVDWLRKIHPKKDGLKK